MKNYLVYSMSFFLLCAFALKKDEFKYRNLPNNDFARGEKLAYIAHYGFINAGRADIEMDSEIHYVNGRPCYKVDVNGRTIGAFSWAMKVEDLWRSYIDTAAVTTQKFYRDILEGRYNLEETTVFDHNTKKGKLVYQKEDRPEKEKTFEFKEYPQDIISGYYYLRTIDYATKKEGDIISMNAIYEDTVYDFKVRYLGREVVKTKVGKINAFAMSPIMPDNELFDGGDSITFWISDDRNRVPVKVKAKMFIGAVEVELIEYSGLKEEFNFDEG